MATYSSPTSLNYAKLSLILLWLALPVVASSPIAEPFPIQPRQQYADDNAPETFEPGTCKSDRSDDYYGLGVRLGMYLTWFQAWIAFNFVPSEIQSALDANAIFLFAVILAMVRCTITDLILQVDALILTHLGAGTIFSVISIWGYRTRYYTLEGPAKAISHFGGFGTHMRLLLCVAFAAFSLYFWTEGMHGPNPGMIAGTGREEDPQCLVLYTFMFSQVEADGPVRLFYVVMCSLLLVYWGIMLITSSLAALARVMKMRMLMKAGQWRTSSRLHYATGLSRKQLRYVYYFLTVATMAWMIFSMALVELLLYYNKLYNVIGWRGRLFFPSQLIPLIVGISGFFRVVYVGFEKWRSPEDTEPSLPADEPLTRLHATSLPHGRNKFKLFARGTRFGQTAPERYVGMEIDPLLDGQPAHLRYLVAYLPWLVLVRWWHLKDKDYEQATYAEPTVPTVRAGAPSVTMPEPAPAAKHQSWGSGRSDFESPAQSPARNKSAG